MYKKKNKGWSKHFDFFILDILCLECSFFLSYGIRHNWVYSFNMEYYRRMGLFLIFVSVCVGLIRENYHGVLRRDNVDELKNVFYHVSFVEIMIIAITFFMKDLYYSREVFLLFWAISIALCFVVRCLWKSLLKHQMIQNREKRRVLVISVSNIVADIIDKLSDGEFLDYEIVGIVLTDCDKKGTYIKGFPVFGTLNTNIEYIHENVVDEVFVHLEPGKFLDKEFINLFIQTGLTVHFDLDGLAGFDTQASIERFSNRTVITTSMKMASAWNLFIKRVMDIFGGLVGIMITGIACIFVVPAIKLADPGPAFFSQTRIGKNGRRFKIYKFRSMYMDAEERKKELMDQNEMQGFMFKMENDPRILKGIGNFIRNTSIDELPQFWNVLKGDMSLVGTRPPTVEEYEMYEMHHLKRMSIKPGITGMWQTSGRSDITDFEEVVKLDTQYIINWSITLDIKLLLKTILVVLKKEGSK